MIPVLIVPCLRSDLVGRMLASVDVPVGQVLVVDNGAGVEAPEACVIRLPANLGVAASWNLGLKLAADGPWWLIVNDDIVFAPGDLTALIDAMAGDDPRLVSLVPDGLAAFALNRPALDRVGYADENFHPAYCEDADLEYRCRLASVPIVALETGIQHIGSATIALPQWSEQNARTYPANLAYYIDKWGGRPRGGERYDSPFDSGANVTEWALYHRRLVDLAWR